MNTKRAVVFANGDFSLKNSVHANVCADDFILCVDGGVRHCLNSGFTPDLLVGDLDSIDDHSSQEILKLGTDCLQYPSEKDASDLELAFSQLCERSIEEVVVLGASGGRTDHHLFNWQLAGSRSWPFRLRLVDDYVDAQLVDPSRPFDSLVSQAQTFSVIPVAGTATGVKVSGAKYPLDNATLAVGSTLGLSNVTGVASSQEPRLQVSVEEGIVLVMLVLSER